MSTSVVSSIPLGSILIFASCVRSFLLMCYPLNTHDFYGWRFVRVNVISKILSRFVVTFSFSKGKPEWDLVKAGVGM